MGFFDSLLGLSAETIFPHDPSDERAWTSSSGYRDHWGGYSGSSHTGLYVRPDDALKVSCVFLGTRIYAEVLGTRPLLFYQELGDRRKPLLKHPIARLLSPSAGVQPNPWQTGAQFRITQIAHCILWGLGLAEIAWDRDASTGELLNPGLNLIPVDPEWITDIDETRNRQSRYKVSEPGRTPRILTQDQVFRFEGFGTHARIPESLLRRSREAVGVWLAQEQFRGSYYLRGAQPSLIAQYKGPPGGLGDDANYQRIQRGIQSAIAGRSNFHKVALVEEVEFKEVGHTARNAQVSELIESQAIEIGTRFFGLPPHMFGGKNPPYSSREYVMQELVQIHMQPKGVLYEGAVHRDLITEDDVVCEHDYDGLLQGSFLEQIQALSIAVMAGILAENETRDRIGYDRVEDEEMDTPRRSVNQDRGGDPQGPRQDAMSESVLSEVAARAGLLQILGKEISFDALAQYLAGTGRGRSLSPSADDRRSEAGAVGEGREGADHSSAHPSSGRRFRTVLENSARQLLKHEIRNLTEKARKYSAQPEEWRSWLTSFYRSHTERVVEALAVDEGAARAYTEEHRARVLQEGVGVVEGWAREEIGVREMMRLAIGEKEQVDR